MGNLDALEHLRKARKYAAGLEEHKDWVHSIEIAMQVELICLAEGNEMVASTALEWSFEYHENEEFPWLEKLVRARELVAGYEKAP